MNDGPLRDRLAAYAAGLDAQLALLRRVHRLALDQNLASKERAADRLARLTSERDEVMRELDGVERDIQPVRQRLADRQAEAAGLEGFAAVSALHRSADALVAGILAVDAATLTELTQAQAERRAASHELETGESTLAAYRRVIAPDAPGPSLIDRQG